MDIVTYALAGLAAIGLTLFGVLYSTEHKILAVWIFFASATLVLLGICLYWQSALRATGRAISYSATLKPLGVTFTRQQWKKTNGPYGATVFAIAIDPLDPETAYAGFSAAYDRNNVRSSVLKTVNGGHSWLPFGSTVWSHEIRSVEVLPDEQLTLLVGVGENLLKWSTQAKDWASIPYFQGIDGDIRSISVSQQDPRVIYVSTGKYWSGATASSASAIGMDEGRSSGKTVQIEWVEDVKQGHLHRSMNGGLSWSTGPFPSVNCVMISPTDSAVVYMVTSDDGVFVSQDSGANWYRQRLEGVAYSVAVSPFNSTTALVGTRSGAFLTRDLGRSWAKVNEVGRQAVLAVAFSKIDESVMYIGAHSGIFESTDGGDFFLLQARGLTHSRVLGITASPNGLTLVGTDGGGLYRRPKGAESWVAAEHRFISLGVGSLALDPSGALYAGTPAGLFRSEDNGASFRPTGYFDLEPVWSIAVAPKNISPLGPATSWFKSRLLVVGTTKGHIYRSTDAGATWEAVANLEGNQVHSLDFAGPDSRIIAALGFGGLMLSGESGLAWEKVGEAIKDLGPQAVVVDLQDSSKLYVGTVKGSIHVSEDAGQSWQRLFSDIPRPVIALEVSQTWLWAGLEAGGVYGLRKEAASWVAVNRGLRHLDVICLGLDPLNTRRLFAGTNNGVFISSDEGRTWDDFSQGIDTSLHINRLAFSADGSILFAGTDRGLYGRTIR